MLPLLFLALGLVLLIVGAEVLVRGATRLALAAGLSRLVIGLVVVALGTSAPEVAISTGAALQGKADLAVGNVVGSNVFNVLFILGGTALIAPLMVQQRLIRIDIPFMIGTGVVLAALAINGLSLLDGALLLALAIGYTVMNLRLGRRESMQSGPPDLGVDTPTGPRAILAALGFLVVGLVGLVTGARFTVEGASDIARALGASDLVIGLTIVAIGTGLPELVTSVLAAVRGERDIAIGNIVGSNVLNVTLVLGLGSLVAPAGLAVARGALTFDIPVMIVVSLALVPIAFTGRIIARWEGAVFLAYYLAYLAHLFLTATVHPGADEFGFALVWFALPLTAVVLVAVVLQELRRLRETRSVAE